MDTAQESYSATDQKTNLELKKLALEVAQLEAPWWRRPSFVLAALPTLLATLTVAYGLANGYFEAVATKLQNQRHDLEADVRAFSEEKTKLLADVRLFSDERSRLVGDIEKIRHQLLLVQGTVSTSPTAREAAQKELRGALERIQSLQTELQRRTIPLPRSK